MAEEKKKDDSDKESQVSPDEGKEAKAKDEKEELILGKFRDLEALKKAYQEAESSGTKMSQQLKKLQEFEQEMTPLLISIQNDPELLKTVRAKLGYETQSPPEKKSPESEAIGKTIKQFSDWQRNQVLSTFETRHGIDKMPETERREVRKEIGKYLNKGRPTLPALNVLDDVLEDAWKLIRVDKLREEGKLEGMIESRSDKLAAIGSIPSGQAKEEEGVILTKKQKGIAKKAGLSEKDYADSLEKVQKTHEISED